MTRALCYCYLFRALENQISLSHSFRLWFCIANVSMWIVRIANTLISHQWNENSKKKKKFNQTLCRRGRKMHTMYETIQDEENSNKNLYTIHNTFKEILLQYNILKMKINENRKHFINTVFVHYTHFSFIYHLIIISADMCVQLNGLQHIQLSDHEPSSICCDFSNEN